MQSISQRKARGILEVGTNLLLDSHFTEATPEEIYQLAVEWLQRTNTIDTYEWRDCRSSRGKYLEFSNGSLLEFANTSWHEQTIGKYALLVCKTPGVTMIYLVK